MLSSWQTTDYLYSKFKKYYALRANKLQSFLLFLAFKEASSKDLIRFSMDYLRIKNSSNKHNFFKFTNQNLVTVKNYWSGSYISIFFADHQKLPRTAVCEALL